MIYGKIRADNDSVLFLDSITSLQHKTYIYLRQRNGVF